MVNRAYYNGLILGTLLKIMRKYPDMRFGQILSNLELTEDLFYEEPDKTLKRICNSEFYKKASAINI